MRTRQVLGHGFVTIFNVFFEKKNNAVNYLETFQVNTCGGPVNGGTTLAIENTKVSAVLDEKL